MSGAESYADATGYAGLNKGEAKNALARAVFFDRLGELRDRSFENQRYRASGLNLAGAAIVAWNMVYLDALSRVLACPGKRSGQTYWLICRLWVGNR